MRLHKLSMTALGPYAGSEEIDFDRLSSSGRFLLTGPTGAGKTTIIDAIVFALYGNVAGEKDSTKDRLRSRLVDRDVRTSVTLEFSTSSGRYEITRTPAYLVPRKNPKDGQEYTKRNASVSLVKLPDDPDAAAIAAARSQAMTRADEVGAEITRAVGLSCDQFTQTIVLPQGKFQTFLRATSKERHDVLRDVFGTRLYDDLQNKLAEQAKDAHNAKKELDTQLATQVATLESQLPEGHPWQSPDLNDVASHPQDLRALLEDLGRSLEAQVQEKLAAAQRAESAHHTASEAYNQSRDLDARLRRRAELVQQQEQLKAGESQATRDRDRLQAARGAQAVGDLAQQAEKLAETASHELKRLERAWPLNEATSALLSAGLPAESAIEAATDSAPGASTDSDPTPGAAGLANTADALFADTAQEELPSAALRPAWRGEEIWAAAWQELRTHASRIDTILHGDSPTQDAGNSGDGSKANPEWDKATTLADECITQSRKLRDTASGLTHLESLEAGLSGRRVALSQQDESISRAQEEIHSLTDLRTSFPEKAAALREKKAAALAAQESLPALTTACDIARARHQAAIDLAKAQKEAGELSSQITEAQQTAQDASLHAHQLRSAWINATAASLVTQLEDGQPCPVCGSFEHPCPAEVSADPVTEDQLKEADTASQQASSKLAALRTKRDALEDRIKDLESTTDDLSIEQASEALREEEAALDAATTQSQRLPELESSLDALDAELKSLEERISDKKASLAAAQAARTKDAEQLHDDEASVTQARGTHASVGQLKGALKAGAEELDLLSSRIESAIQSLTQASHMCHQAIERSHEKGFATLAQALAACMSLEEQTKLEDSLNERAATERSVKKSLEEPEIAVLTGDEDAQLALRQEELKRARNAWQEAVRSHSALQTTASQLASTSMSIEETLEQLVAGTRESAALLRVAELASGKNDQQTPLSTWVLSTRFHEVLSFANQRLQTMSDGRYSLVPSEEEQQQARYRGLGLAVVDRDGDSKPRDPKTLSGGETFFVSLALALALADVVSTESGGVHMETLFIDEGFGTLDSDALDRVMTELGRIQDAGRTVGIISHVDELRRQIPEQIRITPSATGSHLTVVA